MARASPTPSLGELVGRLEQRVAGRLELASILSSSLGEDRARAVALLDVADRLVARGARAPASGARRTRRAAPAKSAYSSAAGVPAKSFSSSAPSLLVLGPVGLDVLRRSRPGPARSPSTTYRCWRDQAHVVLGALPACRRAARRRAGGGRRARRSRGVRPFMALTPVKATIARARQSAPKAPPSRDGERKIANRGHASSGRRVDARIEARVSFSGAMGAFVCQRWSRDRGRRDGRAGRGRAARARRACRRGARAGARSRARWAPGCCCSRPGWRCSSGSACSRRCAPGAARIERVVGTTVDGRRFMDLAYAGLGEGVTASACTAARCSRRCAGAAERAGARAAGRRRGRRSARGGALVDAGGATYGPYDLIVGADGARSTMRRFLPRARAHPRAPLGRAVGRLPGSRRTRSTACSTSTSTARGGWPASCRPAASAVSLFWSIRLDRIEAVRAAGLDGVPRRSAVARARRGAARWRDLRSFDQLLPASYRQVSLPRWHDGTLVLLGDAAHALSPQLGQGANLALMDAAALADAPSLDDFEARAARAGALLRVRRAGAEHRLPERPRRDRVAARPADAARRARPVGPPAHARDAERLAADRSDSFVRKAIAYRWTS